MSDKAKCVRCGADTPTYTFDNDFEVWRRTRRGVYGGSR